MDAMDAHDIAEVTRLPLSRITSGHNPRRFFSQDKHDELVASLRLRGMLQPILLRPSPDPVAQGELTVFAIVAGERRYRAAIEAFGPDGEVPVTIREMTDQEARLASIAENEDRDDTSETEQADAAALVLVDCGGDRAEAARLLCWSPSKLNRRLALAGLSDAVKSALDERRIKIGHAELLAVVPGDKQDKALDTIVTASLDVAKTRELLMRVTQNLGAATFDKAECTTCPFNSGAQRVLFETHVDDGHCTNPGCFQLKADAAAAAAMPSADQAAPPEPAETPDPSQSDDPQPGTCRICGCTEDHACETPCAWADDTQTLCDNPDCVAKAGDPAAAAASGEASTEPAPAPNTKPRSAHQPKVMAAAIAGRVADLREATWRSAVARALAGNVDHARTVIMLAAMTGTISQIKPATLTSRAGLLVGEAFPGLGYTDQLAALRALAGQESDTVLSAIAAAYAKDVQKFGHVTELATAFAVDLRDSWRVDQTFLGRLSKDELKFVAQECGLVEHMGARPFAKLLKAAADKIVDGMLNATGFDWAGRLPGAMTLDGQYGPPPAGEPPAETPALETAD